MSFKRLLPVLIAAVIAVSIFGSASRINAQTPVEITFYWSSAVAGDLPKIFQGYADQFNNANSDVHVTLVYGGGYPDTLKKIQTEVGGGGTSADVAILLATDVYTLADNDYIVPMDDFIKNTKDGDAYIKDFFPAFQAPAFNTVNMSSRSRIPPPTVKGTKTCSATSRTVSRSIARFCALAMMS